MSTYETKEYHVTQLAFVPSSGQVLALPSATVSIALAVLSLYTYIIVLSGGVQQCFVRPRDPHVRDIYSPPPFCRTLLRRISSKVLGTHNSYHRRTNIPALGNFWPSDYPSLAAQLDAGVRHIELDVHFDWKSGR